MVELRWFTLHGDDDAVLQMRQRVDGEWTEWEEIVAKDPWTGQTIRCVARRAD